MLIKSYAGDVIIDNASLGIVDGVWGDIRIQADDTISYDNAEIVAAHHYYLVSDNFVGTPFRLEEGDHLGCPST